MKYSNIDATCTSELLYICIYNIKRSQKNKCYNSQEAAHSIERVSHNRHIVCYASFCSLISSKYIQPALEILLVHVLSPNTHTWRYINHYWIKPPNFCLLGDLHIAKCLTKKKDRYYSYSTIKVNIKNKCLTRLWCPPSISYFDSASWSVGAHVHNIWADEIF